MKLNSNSTVHSVSAVFAGGVNILSDRRVGWGERPAVQGSRVNGDSGSASGMLYLEKWVLSGCFHKDW